MVYCKNCGVELEPTMEVCPLCQLPLGAVVPEAMITNGRKKPVPVPYGLEKMTGRQKRKLAWEIISIILLSAVVGLVIINFSINKRISWAQYPILICLILFFHVTAYTLFKKNIFLRTVGSFLASCVSLYVLGTITSRQDVVLKVEIPILFSADMAILCMMIIVSSARQKGVNLIAAGFILAGALCIAIEMILSFYLQSSLQLFWSAIAGSCSVLIAIVLFFVHFRLKKGQSLKKTFHI
jgi:hypothetical protein